MIQQSVVVNINVKNTPKKAFFVNSPYKTTGRFLFAHGEQAKLSVDLHHVNTSDTEPREDGAADG